MNLYIIFLKYAEYIAAALSKVWANQAKIPSTEEMRKWSDAHVAEKGGYGKNFQSLGAQGTRGWLSRNSSLFRGGIDGYLSFLKK